MILVPSSDATEWILNEVGLDELAVAVIKPIKGMNSQTGQAGRESSFSVSLEGSATGPESVRPDQTRGRTDSLQSRSLVWAQALISLSSPANPIADTFY